MNRTWFFVLIIILSVCRVSAQSVDTLNINVQDAEKSFLDHNFQLLANKYKIDADKALVQQARLWDNPNLYLEKNAYNPVTHGVFEGGSNGESIVQLQQLIQLAGKRSERIRLAGLQAQMTEDEFYDLMRTLKYQLRTGFYNLYFLQRSLSIYDEELTTLGNLLDAFQLQYQKGNISLKEVVRLRALAFSLQNEKLDVQRQISDAEMELNTLLQQSRPVYYRPQLSDEETSKGSLSELSFDKLLQDAKDNRYDLKMQQDALHYSESNLAFQRALAVPDIRLGGTFDKAGSYIFNYTGLGIAVDLPLWNRNQGNIKSARYMIQSQQALLDNYQNIVQNELLNAYNKVTAFEQQYSKVDVHFSQDFQELVNAIEQNYARKNMSLLEFIDFFETYKESMLQLNKLKNDRLNAYEELNYVVGKNEFNK